MNWTTEQVLALAPDAGSAKSGRELASARKWVSAGRSEAAVWGECQGSGASPYQTQIDLSGPTFKCSCPSRKFPCKHGLGLLLLTVASPSDVIAHEPPEWVAAWLTGRSLRAERRGQSEEADGEREVRATASAAKTAAAREAKVAAGIDELDLWLRDIVRGGLADLKTKPASFFRDRASRLVDAQAPGLAKLISELGWSVGTGGSWEEKALERIGLIFLAMEGHRRKGALPNELRADVRAVVGWTQSKEEILGRSGVSDTWVTVGHRTNDEGNLVVQRIWLVGVTTRRWAQLVNHSHHSQPNILPFATGQTFAAEVVYFDGSGSRALVKSRSDAAPIRAEQLPFGTALNASAIYAAAVASNPWTESVPVGLAAAVPVPSSSSWSLRDDGHLGVPSQALPIAANVDNMVLWRLAAICGGRPNMIFGEWDGRGFLPLSVWSQGAMTSI